MGLIAKQGGGDFQIAPVGQFLAICYQVVDMGHQFSPTYNKWHDKVRFAFELHGENMTGSGSGLMDDGRPFTVSTEFTNSLSENSNLRPFLEGWRGRPFTEQELDGFDVSNVLGAACMLTIQHTQQNGKTYANLTTATPMLKVLTKPAQVNPPLLFSMDPWDRAKFDSLPQWVRARIEKSKEYIERFGGTISTPQAAQTAPPAAAAPFNDDIPF